MQRQLARLKTGCNSLFHDFLNKQLEACRSLISTLETKYPESDFPCLMRASLLHREKHSDKAVELLKVCVLLVLFLNTPKSFHYKLTVQYLQGSPNYLMCSLKTFFWQTVEVLFWKDCLHADVYLRNRKHVPCFYRGVET